MGTIVGASNELTGITMVTAYDVAEVMMTCYEMTEIAMVTTYDVAEVIMTYYETT